MWASAPPEILCVIKVGVESYKCKSKRISLLFYRRHQVAGYNERFAWVNLEPLFIAHQKLMGTLRYDSEMDFRKDVK